MLDGQTMAVPLSVMVLISLCVTSSIGARIIANFRLKEPVDETPRLHLPLYTYHVCAAACMSADSCTSFKIEFSTKACVLGVASDQTGQQQSNGVQYEREHFQPKQYNVDELFDPIPVSVLVNYPIFRSPVTSQSHNEAEGSCSQCGKQLCSLVDLKDAYDVGYRDDQWGFTSELDHKAKVTSCDGFLTGDECYSFVEGNANKSLIPFTPNINFNGSAFCCDNEEYQYPIFSVNERYQNDNLSQPRARCAECGQQLCTLDQLRAAYEAGFRQTKWSLYDTQDRLTKVINCWEYYYLRNECHFIVKGNYNESLIPNWLNSGANGRPLCCPRCQVDKTYPIFRTAESYSVSDLSDAQNSCNLCGMQVCTLAQLRAAYNAGYRDNTWGLIDIKGRHAKVSSCDELSNSPDELSNSPDECHFIVNGVSSESLIPHAITTATSDPAYCCQRCDTFINYPIFSVNKRYPNGDLSQPRARCAVCGQQLCTLDQLRAAYEAGFRHSRLGLYDTQDRITMVNPCGEYYYNRNECHFVVEGNYTESLIPNWLKTGETGRPLCCPRCQVDKTYHIFRTSESYSVSDLSDAQNSCNLCGMQICTLAQLRAAYNAGYRDNTWGLIDIKGRHAKVSPCDELSNSPDELSNSPDELSNSPDELSNSPDECHFIGDGISSESLIPHAITTATSDPAYCCRRCDKFINYPIIRSNEHYRNDDLSQPRARCAECGQQLCTLDQLRAAYEAGFRHSKWGLYDTQDRIAMVTPCWEYYYRRHECHFVVPGNYTESLIPNFPKPGTNGNPLCCPRCQVDTKYPIFKTSESNSADLTEARGSCALCGMKLCSLAQLKEAYDAGYRSLVWGLYDVEGRHARVASCGTFWEDPRECYFVVAENATASLIPNTPVSREREAAYCCKPV